MPKPSISDETYSDQEAVARREAALKRMLNTPHKPHKPIKKTKSSPDRQNDKTGPKET